MLAAGAAEGMGAAAGAAAGVAAGSEGKVPAGTGVAAGSEGVCACAGREATTLAASSEATIKREVRSREERNE